MSHHKQLNWGYNDDREIGPNEWGKYYQTGKNQSPINIIVDFCALNGSHHHKHRIASPEDHSTSTTTCCFNNNGSRHINDPPMPTNAAASSLAACLRRTHLDSIGEDDHQRSSSTSSSQSSSSSSSPVQNSNSDSCDDDNYDNYDNRTHSTCAKQQHQQQHHHRSSSIKCVDCFPASALSLTKGRSLAEQNTRHCVSNKKLFLGYPRYMSSSVQLCNTGHSWQINIPPELASHTLLSGPPLGDREYRLAQVHAHWSEDSSHGSEHQINGKSFAAEIHFVHWNCTDFRSIEEASKHKHGLAVLGVLVMALEGEQNKNKHLDKIISALNQIKSPNSSTELRTKLDLKKLFPANRWSYASYEGSLTTPPLSEVVDWIVFLNPITCSTNQIEQFHQINCESPGRAAAAANPMRRNCRPIQPTNNRLVSIWTHPSSTN